MDIRILMFPFAFSCVFALSATAQQVQKISYVEAMDKLLQTSRAIKMADKEVEGVQRERGRLDALWYPQVQAEGAYVHLSEDIKVEQRLSYFTNPIKEYVHQQLPSDVLISSLLDKVGSYTLTFPLLERNMSTVDVTAEWVAFSGGKRWLAHKVGRDMVEMAETNREAVNAAELVALVENYYGLVLAQKTVEVRRLAYAGLLRHYTDALKMEAAGVIDKASRLAVQVGVAEAHRELEAAQSDERTVNQALCALLGVVDGTLLIPSSLLFVQDDLPEEDFFTEKVLAANQGMKALRLQQDIVKSQLRMEQSAYLPDIALMAKQTLWSQGIPSNLVPRQMVGVGFTWTLFDGLDREKRISQMRIAGQTVELERDELASDLVVAVGGLYTALIKAKGSVEVLDSTIVLGEELLKVRTLAFKEGMATSVEVVDAETGLADARLARLAACYAYDVALIKLLALCGMPEQFLMYME